MRHLALLATLFLVAGSSLADIAPPPPPKGKKYVGSDVSVVLDKRVKGYTFVLSVAQGPGAPEFKYTSIELSEKPTSMPPGGRHTFISVLAISEVEAKKYASKKDLIAAIEKRTLKSVREMAVGGGSDLTDTTDKRGAIPWKYTITAIDATKGITVKIERDGKPFEPKESRDNSDGDVGDDSQAKAASTNRSLLAGVFAAVAFVTLGLWLFRRRSV